MKFSDLTLRLIKYIYYNPTIPRFPAVLFCIPRFTSLKKAFQIWTRPFQADRILLISYPRSGSSWLGEILSYSPDIYYLREPVTQTMGQLHGYYALINPDMDLKTLLRYIKYADLGFTGLPAKGIKYIIFNNQESLPLNQRGNRLFIKEVNLLAADFFLKRYKPRTIILVRHPAAIADSFHRMGWLTKGWERFGFEYGNRMKAICDLSKKYASDIIQFEEIATNPEDLIPKLFNELKLSTPADLETLINSYTRYNKESKGPYQTKRFSQREVNKWRNNLPRDKIKQLKTGYLKSDFKYYQSDTDW